MMCPLYRGCELIVAKNGEIKFGEKRGKKEGRKWVRKRNERININE